MLKKHKSPHTEGFPTKFTYHLFSMSVQNRFEYIYQLSECQKIVMVENWKLENASPLIVLKHSQKFMLIIPILGIDLVKLST